jgi:hypothetical protein
MDCPHGSTLADGRCYRLADDQMSWSEARDECRKHGADLASFSSQQDMRWVTASFLRVEHSSNPVWIDGRPGAPMGRLREGDGPDDCVYMKPDHTYSVATSCTDDWFHGLCVVDATPVDVIPSSPADTTVTITVRERTGDSVRTVEYKVDTAGGQSPGAVTAAVHRALTRRLPITVTNEHTAQLSDGQCASADGAAQCPSTSQSAPKPAVPQASPVQPSVVCCTHALSQRHITSLLLLTCLPVSETSPGGAHPGHGRSACSAAGHPVRDAHQEVRDFRGQAVGRRR